MKKKSRELIFSENINLQNDFKLPSEIPDQRPDSYPDYNMLVKEAKINCLNGLLRCLDRRKRLVFILGAIFDVPSSIGSEILEISQTNFRKILSRSREAISNVEGGGVRTPFDLCLY